MKTIRINEIFYSIQGESSRIGFPTVFIRLTGCPMRCTYCDTAYAFHQGNQQEIDAILNTVQQYPTKFVTVTGGEPLAQKNCLDLLNRLCDQDYEVSLETGGGIDISPVNAKVKIILDIKTPKSGEAENNFWPNLKQIKPMDEIKFVVADQEDFKWALQTISEHQLDPKKILFSPVYGQLEGELLAKWILDCGIEARLQLQLHKILWGEKQGV
jgi:7-carboxy-7-deazaguanine synthase